MLVGLEAILPLFFIIGCGYLARCTVLDESMLPAINQFVYFFAVPALLFRAAMGMPLEGILYWPGILGFLLGVLLTLLLQLILIGRLDPGLATEKKIILLMNSAFANFAYMGIPLTFTILGDQVGPITVMIILSGNLLIIGGAHLAIEFQRQHRLQPDSLVVILNNSLLRNPIFISTCFGIIFSAFGLTLPDVIDKSTQWLADAAIPVALFCLGAGLKFRSHPGHGKLLASVILIKLVCHPALTWFALWLLGVNSPLWLAAIVLLTALPTGALAHVVALKYNAFPKETSQIIVVSTLVSLLTVTLWVSLINRYLLL